MIIPDATGGTMQNDLNDRIAARGRELFASIAGEKPSLFDNGTWLGKVMDWSMRNEQFKVRLFRFVDVFPSLTTGKPFTDHSRDYSVGEEEMPPCLATGARVAGMLGAFGGAVLNKVLSANIEEMA